MYTKTLEESLKMLLNSFSIESLIFSVKKDVTTFKKFIIQIIEISGKNNTTAKNIEKIKVFSVIIWFIPLISKTMHLSKKVQ